MWYNDILIILLGFVAVLMILMALLMAARMGKQRRPSEENVEQPEKIFIEKGFENNKPPETVTDPVNPPDPKLDDTVSTEIEKLEPENSEPEPIEGVIEPEPEVDETVIITPIEPIIVEPEPTIDAPEPIDEVAITPNETFYDPEPEVPTTIIEEEPDSEIPDIPEVELPPLEPDEPEPIPEEIPPEPTPEPEPEPIVPKVKSEKPRKLYRKPIIDESDPSLKVDLGVNTCPHCGSKVPDTIYCILCGKPLDPDNAIGYIEDEE